MGILVASCCTAAAPAQAPGVSITQSGGSTSLSETGPTSDTYTIVLASQPAAGVDIVVDPDEQAHVGAGGGLAIQISFTTENWNEPQTITVTAVNDAVMEGPHTSIITHTAISDDPAYSGIAIAAVSAAVTDNDVAGVIIAESGLSTDVSENGPTSDSYTIALRSRPTATVTITITPDAQVDLGPGPGEPLTVVIGPASWSFARQVIVTAVDDAVAEGPHVALIEHSVTSTDPHYDNIAVPDLTANLTDNDTAGVTIAESAGSTDVNEEGATSDSYQVALDRQPTDPVTISVTPDGQTDLGAGPGNPVTLTYLPGTWTVVRTITVTALDDPFPEGPHVSTITHTVSSGDPAYNGVSVNDVTVHVTDNDAPGISITETNGATEVSEQGPTSDTYTVVLESQPAAAVNIAITSDAQTDVGAGPGGEITLSFNAGDWNVPKSVSVTAVDDWRAEGLQASTITHVVTSTDPDYDGIAVDDLMAHVIDNDTAGVSVTESGGSTALNEEGPTSDSYTIQLDSEPLAAVSIRVQPDAQANAGAGPGAAVTLTFTDADWNLPQTVNITAVDDAVAEGVHTSTVAHTVSSSDTVYQGMETLDVLAQVTDNDTAAVNVVESDGSTDASEEGPTSDTYSVTLNSQPVANVVVAVDPDAQTTVGAGAGVQITLTFSADDWDVPQTVTVTAVDDAVAEGAHLSLIAHTASSADSFYGGIAGPDVTAHLVDNDTAGVVLAESEESTDVDEQGPTTDTYTLVLLSQPTVDVAITVDPDGQTNVGTGAGNPVTLTFTSTNWDVPRTVLVTAVNDALVEGPHTSTITHTTASSDAFYDDFTIPDLTAHVTDNDTAAVNVGESDGSTAVDEQGPTSDTYTLVLNSQPIADVVITAQPDEQTDAGAGAGASVTITFTALNWSTPRTVTVLAVDDYSAEGAHTAIITHTAASDDDNYDGLEIVSVTVYITDNDSAGVTLTESDGSTEVAELGPTSDTYTLVLDSRPAADVIITVTPDTQTSVGTGAGNPVTLTFTSGDWNVPQTVTVTAVDDAVAEGLHSSTIAHSVASTDEAYDGFAVPAVTAHIDDNDIPSVTVAQSGGSTSVSEQGPTSDSYTLVLGSPPTADVIIAVSPDVQASVGAGPGAPVSLTFTTANWQEPQTVVVTAVDDAIAEGAHTAVIAHAATSSDARYDEFPIAGVTAQVTDNDTAGISLVESGGSTGVNEQGPTSDTYTLVLNSQPTATVTITAAADGQINLGAGPGVPLELQIEPAGWNVPRTVVVTAVDDAVSEGPHTTVISHAAESADSRYDGRSIPEVLAHIADNDVVGVTVTESGGSTNVSEQGATSDSYTIVLTGRPVADVVVTVDPDVQTNLGSGPGAAIVLTFAPADWNVTQTVNVTAVDDAVAESSHSSTISHSVTSEDLDYHGLAIAPITAHVTDNDSVGVNVVQSGGSTEVDEAGPTTDTYTLTLNSQPTANVVLTIDPDTQTDVGAGPGAARDLTFTAGDWHVVRTVTVTAAADYLVEGPHTSTIAHSAASGDQSYAGIPVAGITVQVADDDSAGISAVESAGSTAVSEEGPTWDAYTLVLQSQPASNVVITITPDAQITLGAGAGSPVSLTFTAANWYTAQTVTVTAVDDALAEGPHTSTITHAVASADPLYAGMALGGITITLTDNDTAGVAVTESSGSTDVDENGPTIDTYTLVLLSQPAANVAITVTPDGQLNLGAGPGNPVSVLFTPPAWDVPRTVMVTAVDDVFPEGAHQATLTHSVASTDTSYDGFAVAEIVVHISDNDVSGVIITETDGLTSVGEEGLSSDTYTIVLGSEPTADVAVVVDPDPQTDVGAGPGLPGLLTFTPHTWDVPRTVVVMAVNDAYPEGAHTSTITHAAQSEDPDYDGIPIADVTVHIADNDDGAVIITESGGSTAISEDGPTSDAYTVVLGTQPASDVIIVATGDDQSELDAGGGVPVVLTFTSANWDVPQTLTVTAIDDARVEDLHESRLTHTVDSADSSYDGLAVPALTVHISDNDTAGVRLLESRGLTTVDEWGPTSDTYTLVLRSQPNANVSITVASDGQTRLGPRGGSVLVLTFTTGNWDVPQTVTVAAVADGQREGPHDSTIVHVVTSSDPHYDGIAVRDVTTHVADAPEEKLKGPPVAMDMALTAIAGEDLAIVPQAYDPDGNAVLTYEILELPAHGAWYGDPPAFSYVADGGYEGPDFVVFRVSNGTSWSEPATLTIEVVSRDVYTVVTEQIPGLNLCGAGGVSATLFLTVLLFAARGPLVRFKKNTSAAQ